MAARLKLLAKSAGRGLKWWLVFFKSTLTSMSNCSWLALRPNDDIYKDNAQELQGVVVYSVA